jgi:hypothetical protein
MVKMKVWFKNEHFHNCSIITHHQTANVVGSSLKPDYFDLPETRK